MQPAEHNVILATDCGSTTPRINFRTRVINLTVRVPKNMDVEVDDGSGEVKIAQINGNIQIDDGSGEINIRDIRGDVGIDDGSGTFVEIHFTNSPHVFIPKRRIGPALHSDCALTRLIT